MDPQTLKDLQKTSKLNKVLVYIADLHVRQDSGALLVHITTTFLIALEDHALEGSFFYALHKLVVGKCILFYH